MVNRRGVKEDGMRWKKVREGNMIGMEREKHRVRYRLRDRQLKGKKEFYMDK